MNSLELLQAYFKGEKYEFKRDVQEEIALQNKQSLTPFLYYVYGEPFFNVYLGCTLIQEKFFTLQKEITKLFNENKIKHYFIKGSVLANLYPDPVLRTRGDIDVVVQECDYEKAQKILSNHNYKFYDESDLHAEFYKNDLLIELHNKLVSKSNNLYFYFKDDFSHTSIISGFEYNLDPNYHFIYLLCHLNTHLKVGEGLRSILDFYYLNKKYKLDYTYIETELNKINLFNLYISILNCIYKITGDKITSYREKNVDSLLSYMLNNGIHGHNSLEDKFEKKIALSDNSKFKYLMSEIFLNKNKCKALYPKLSKCILLYPIITIHRCFYLLLYKRHDFNKFIKTKRDNRNLKSFFKNYGIN